MPRLTNTSPDLQIQAQTCKYKPGLQIHAQPCKYKPRPANPSQDLQIQAQASLIYVYYKSYTKVISSGPRGHSLLFRPRPANISKHHRT